MRVGILGAGALGKALAARLAAAGHDVVLSGSRDQTALALAAEALGVEHADPAAMADTVEVLALALPWGAVGTAITDLGCLPGKIIWDCTNPLLPDFSGLSIGTTTSAGEEIAKQAPLARVVKGIPPMAELLASGHPTVGGRPPGLFVASDDAGAKEAVATLMTSLPAEVTDAGGLSAARLIEPAMMLLVRLAYGLGHGPRVALRFEVDAMP